MDIPSIIDVAGSCHDSRDVYYSLNLGGVRDGLGSGEGGHSRSPEDTKAAEFEFRRAVADPAGPREDTPLRQFGTVRPAGWAAQPSERSAEPMPQ